MRWSERCNVTMDLVTARQITAALVVLTVVGAAGWLVPLASSPGGGDAFTVERVYVENGNRITVASLYLPAGEADVPGVVFGSGSGSPPKLYSNYGRALAGNGFAVLVPGMTYELEPGRPVPWEIVRGEARIRERSTENYLAWVGYLSTHPRVDERRLVVGGHSGGANGAYRAAYERPDVRGVVAIAGRFPPDREEPLRTNLLLATGSDDSLVPPSKLTEVSEALIGRAVRPGERVGSFEEGTAVRVVVADGENHLTETDSPKLVRAVTDWALRSVGEEPTEPGEVTVRPIRSVLFQFLSGLVGVLGATALVGRRVRSASDDPCRHLVAAVALFGFVALVVTTLSRGVYYFGPVQPLKYAVLGGIALVVGTALDRTAARSPRFDSRLASMPLDLLFLSLATALFTLASTRFVTFQLVTQVVFTAVFLALLLPFLVLFAALGVERRTRWLFVGLAVIALFPPVVPPYL